MKVLCLVSSQPGHIDFGGLGFLSIATSLRGRGHTVIWLAPGQHKSLLEDRQFLVTTRLPVDALALANIISAEVQEGHNSPISRRINVMRKFSSLFAEIQPDLILADRLLALAPLVAGSLGIPVAVMGSPGGYWQRTGAGVKRVVKPVTKYLEIGERLVKELKWPSSPLPSFWGHSTRANISFFSKFFYGPTAPRGDEAWYVNHFCPQPASQERIAHGVSFGNSGNEERMHQVVAMLLDSTPIAEHFQIFCGNRDSVLQRYESEENARLKIERWTPFATAFPRLKNLVCFGGIGTLWHAINNEVPMLIVVGGIGDQEENCRRANALGLAECICGEALDAAKLKDRWHRLHTGAHLDAIRAFKAPKNYTDTFETSVERLEHLGRHR